MAIKDIIILSLIGYLLLENFLYKRKVANALTSFYNFIVEVENKFFITDKYIDRIDFDLNGIIYDYYNHLTNLQHIVNGHAYKVNLTPEQEITIVKLEQVINAQARLRGLPPIYLRPQ